MLFNSFSFVGCFGALALVYYALPHRWRWPLLLATSLGFYATFDYRYVLLLVAVTIVTFVAGLAIEDAVGSVARRTRLVAGVMVTLGALFTFKYYDFFASSLDSLWAPPVPLLPRLDMVVAAGLSFYVFSCVAYLADVHAKRLPAERHVGYFALYVSFFPKLLAGPIERAKPMLEQFRRPVAFSAAGVTHGLQLLLWGLFKKVVIADRLAAFVDTTYRQPSFASPTDLVLATYFFAFQLYCDFSGYSDAAIGIAKVLGFEFTENFKRPYLSTSVREFWSRRWHMSLASWFRDYMYIPLGGNRVSAARSYANVMAVFVASGLWHGANWTFVVWGGVNGLYQVCSLLTAGMRARAVGWLDGPAWLGAIGRGLLTFHLVLFTWVFFRAQTFEDATTVLYRIGAGASTLPQGLATRLSTGDVPLFIGLIVFLMVVEAIDEGRSIWERARRWPVALRWAAYYALIMGLMVLGSWKLKQFVYMQF